MAAVALFRGTRFRTRADRRKSCELYPLRKNAAPDFVVLVSACLRRDRPAEAGRAGGERA